MGYNEDMKGPPSYVGRLMLTGPQCIHQRATNPNIGLAFSQLAYLRGSSGANNLSLSAASKSFLKVVFNFEDFT